jgi:hypothetical protein
MHTSRLRRLEQPSDAERLLASYIAASGLLPVDARQVLQRPELPGELRRVLILATAARQAWSCWAHNFRIWLFTGEISPSPCREQGAPVLQVNQWAEDGTLEAAGLWITDSEGSWHRCSD